MPRQMGELRRLCIEWNDLVPLARARGIRVRPRRHFHMDRVQARRRVADLRAMLAPFYQPNRAVELALDIDTFGVEIELIRPQNLSMYQLADRIRENGVMCQVETYNHITRTHWKIVTDASLPRSGAEIVSPPLSGEEGLEAMRRVCKTTIDRNCDADRRHCGFHVHVGSGRRQMDFFKNLARLYHHFEKAIDSFMSPSRRGNVNPFCTSIRMNEDHLEAAQNLTEICRALGQEPFDYSGHRLNLRNSTRYRKLNLLPAMNPTSPTVEFRQHQGTSEPMKAEMWVRLCLRMVKKAMATTKEEIRLMNQDFDAFMQFVEATEGEKSFFANRREYFAAREQRRAA